MIVLHAGPWLMLNIAGFPLAYFKRLSVADGAVIRARSVVYDGQQLSRRGNG